jgi:hypothetical protein
MLLTATLVSPLAAQGDRVTLANGVVLSDLRVVSFDVRSVKFVRANAQHQEASDQVPKVELEKVAELLRPAGRMHDALLPMAREQVAAKNALVAQFLFLAAADAAFAAGKSAEGLAALEELTRALPECGLAPVAYRRRFEFQHAQGAKGIGAAGAVAKKYLADANGGAWPQGFSLEAEFLLVLAERSNARVFQTKLRTLVEKAAGPAPVLADRVRVELAHTLRAAKDGAGARRVYEATLARDDGDQTARAGAWLGLGRLALDEAAPDDKDALRRAMTSFLRVRTECRQAWPGLRAEALYEAAVAAERWRGPDHAQVAAVCRAALQAEFAGSEWHEKAGR